MATIKIMQGHFGKVIDNAGNVAARAYAQIDGRWQLHTALPGGGTKFIGLVPFATVAGWLTQQAIVADLTT